MSEIKILPENKDKIVEIPLEQIFVRKNWNGRSGNWTANDGDESSQQFVDLMLNIKEHGQKEPVGVRVNTENPEQPYELVKGFRRHAAITKIAADEKLTKPTIRAVVQRLDDVAARMENIVENTARAQLKSADMCWSIKELVKVAKENGTPMTGTQIARAVAIDQSWCSKLMRIGDGLKVAILDKWRTTPVSISVDNMLEIAKLPTKEEQAEAFNELIRCEVLEPGEDDGAKKNPLDAVKKRGSELARLLGSLEREGLINTDALDFDTHLELMVKLPKKVNANQKRSIAAAMRKAWEAEKNREDADGEEPEDESLRDKPKRRKVDD